MTLRDEAIASAEAVFDQGQFQAALADLVARPTESQNAEAGPHLRAYLIEAMTPMLEALGFDCAVHENPADGPPILTAMRIEGPDLPTVLIYGHGDVVMGQGDRWKSGLMPFVVTDLGDRLYGRGIADNKAQHLINLLALEAVIKVRGSLGFNVKVLIEMGEEVGSPGLKAFCDAQKDLLQADVLIASDGPRLRAAVPTIFTGSRGGVNFDLAVRLRDGAHHSGNFGGLLADPAVILAHAIATITDARGQILVPEWRPTSLTPRVQEVLAQLPPHEAGVPLDADWGEPDLTPAERVFGWNSFAVLAMTSGVPEAPLNAIAGEARATCQLRFVVGHLDAIGFPQVTITQTMHPFPATRLDPDHPMVGFVARSIEKTTGEAPDLLPNLGGSLPNDCFAEVLGLPTLWIPHSYAGCAQHAPNEHILKPLSRQALGVMAGVFADIAEGGLPRP